MRGRIAFTACAGLRRGAVRRRSGRDARADGRWARLAPGGGQTGRGMCVWAGGGRQAELDAAAAANPDLQTSAARGANDGIVGDVCACQ